MPRTEFREFFQKATGEWPYPYQEKLAGEAVRSRAIHVPTGAGKTAAAVVAWLWRWRFDPENTPRRLVYCLPMRVLVEQTRDEAEEWVEKLRLGAEVKVHTLMGGEPADDWALYPERAAILVGTQDMLLSRALNRGYAMSRRQWPVHFGLLNNDCVWVVDEVQLMGPGLSTALQLEAFRETAIGATEYFGTERPCVSWYMSATASRRMLASREWRHEEGDRRPADFVLELSEEEKSDTSSRLGKCLRAVKVVGCHREWYIDSEESAVQIWNEHQKMTEALGDNEPALPRRTLVICNTVDRARDLHQGLDNLMGQPGSARLVLLHSRFRPGERQRQMDRLAAANGAGGQIVVATQVIEAGVDLSSAILWTEVAPVASLVQRLGRLNRAGEFGHSGQLHLPWVPRALVLGIKLPEVPPGAKKEVRERIERERTRAYLPYDRTECELALDAFQAITDGSPAGLRDALHARLEEALKPPAYGLRRHELLDFFDTDSNLSLGYTDVSPFVRGTDPDTDVYVVWRDWEGREPPFDFDIGSAEVCAVPVWKFLGLKTWRKGFVWLGKAQYRGRAEDGWRPARKENVFPGVTVLLPLEAGGYREDGGWTGEAEDNALQSAYTVARRPSDEDLLSALEEGWQGISEHTADVRGEVLAILEALRISPESEVGQAVLLAVRWHDYGKNLRRWQAATRLVALKAQLVWPRGLAPVGKFSVKSSPLLQGKTGAELQRAISCLRRAFRPGLRHEVASALALRQHNRADGHGPDMFALLSEYLVMSHHGYVRKVLRDELPRNPLRSRRAVDEVRGVREGARLGAIFVGGEALPPVARLSIECRQMGTCTDGSESWTKGVLRLLDDFRPYRLAFFEAVVRAADRRASASPRSGVVVAVPRELGE